MAEGTPEHKDEHLGSEGFETNPALFTRGSTQEAELVHVLFIDLIGYSLLKTDQGSEMVEELFSLVRETPEFKRAKERNQLLLLPSGDGTAIVFFQVPPAAPVRCALEIARAIESHPEIKLRMGVNSGPVLRITDIKGDAVVAGAGINYAARAMDCGDAGHILLTKATAEVLLETRWANSIHDLGEFEVKHGKRLHLYNVCRAGLGNPEPPTRNRVQPSPTSEPDRPRERPAPPTPARPLKRIFSLVWKYPKTTSCLAALLVIAIPFILIFPSSEIAPELSIMPLDPGGEASVVSPQISPDVKHFIYARKDAGKWDIYMRDFDMSAMKNAPVKLTENMPGDNIQPSFSPDGKVVFASERGPVFSKDRKMVPSDEIGGIFSVDPRKINLGAKRLTQRGYNPAWSPDGKKIVYGMESIVRPEDRTTVLSQLSCLDGVDVDMRVESSLASAPNAYKGDAVQPVWSPHGTRLAFWFNRNGHRDIGTIRSDGTDFVQVTDDAFLDWNPVWSPDGYLYFASDRGGDGMHLWRVLVSETSGKVQGPFTELRGSPPDPEYVSFSRDGRTVTFVQRVFRSDLYKVSFDPVSCRVGHPIEVRSGRASRPDVSNDGRFVVFDTAGTKSDNISTIDTDTLEFQSLSSDGNMNRGPRWSRDDKQIAFFSNRGGSFQIWTMPAGGSGEAKKLSDLPGFQSANFLYPVWSPVDDRIAFTRMGDTPAEYQTFILRMGQDGERRMIGLPKLPDLNVSFVAWSWSPDGHTLAGYRQRSDGKFVGIMTYDIGRNEFMPPLTHFGSDPVWLNDGSKRILFLHKGQIYIVDSSAKAPESGVRQVLSAEDNGQDFEVGRRGFSLSRDNRLIYFSRQETRTVLYLATLVSSDTAHRSLLDRMRSLFSR